MKYELIPISKNQCDAVTQGQLLLHTIPSVNISFMGLTKHVKKVDRHIGMSVHGMLDRVN